MAAAGHCKRRPSEEDVDAGDERRTEDSRLEEIEMDPNMPPQLPPPSPEYRFRWELVAMFGMCLLFVWLAARMGAMGGQWHDLAWRLGIPDSDRYGQFVSLGTICVLVLVIVRILRR
jgi:hypothetical protein